jgi:hypothetical protein
MDLRHSARLLRVLLAEIEIIETEERAERRDWQSQAGSPLGNRRHCSAVKRRIAAGLEGARIIGRRHELSPAALEQELQGLTKRKPKVEQSGTAARIERRLGLVAGGGR